MVLIPCFVIPTGDEHNIKGFFVKFVERSEDFNNCSWGTALITYMCDGIRESKIDEKKKCNQRQPLGCIGKLTSSFFLNN